MRMRLMTALALCALAVFVGSTGPPEATVETSMDMATFHAILTEPAAPATDVTATYAFVVDNDVGWAPATAALNGNRYLSAGALATRTKEVVTARSPRVAGRTHRIADFYQNLHAGSRASPSTMDALALRPPRVDRT